MNLENIGSEKKESQKTHIVWPPVYEMSKTGNSVERESSLVVAYGWTGRELKG